MVPGPFTYMSIMKLNRYNEETAVVVLLTNYGEKQDQTCGFARSMTVSGTCICVPWRIYPMQSQMAGVIIA